MTQLSKITVTYRSNYNGCDLSTEINGSEEDLFDLNEHRKKGEDVIDVILSWAGHNCDTYGEFQGNIAALKQFATKAVQETFGQDVVVTFKEDKFST